MTVMMMVDGETWGCRCLAVGDHADAPGCSSPQGGRVVGFEQFRWSGSSFCFFSPLSSRPARRIS